MSDIERKAKCKHVPYSFINYDEVEDKYKEEARNITRIIERRTYLENLKKEKETLTKEQRKVLAKKRFRKTLKKKRLSLVCEICMGLVKENKDIGIGIKDNKVYHKNCAWQENIPVRSFGTSHASNLKSSIV